LFWKYMARRRGHPALAVAIIVATIALAGMTFIPGSWWFITIAYVPAFLAWLVDKIAPRLPRFHVARTTRTRSRSTRPGPWAWTRRHRNEAVRVAASDTAVKTQLLGMIKASPRGLSIMDASKLLHLPSDRVKVLIYELIGTGQIEGTFTSKQLFMPRTSIEDAVASNEQHFARWDEASRNKDGKL
ncbi:MAG: hypothetical protein GYA24_08030, partial [Candidatus Lokiarchaeota archaeon]|nr:hypothetical protein [Candidatus Lokiarchaeota archaeon]